MQIGSSSVNRNSDPDSDDSNSEKIALKGDSLSVLPTNPASSPNPAPSPSSQPRNIASDDLSAIEALGIRAEEQEEEEEEDQDDDDWLMSDQDIQQHNSTSSQLAASSEGHASTIPKIKSMADRDLEKVQAQFKDAGYREGITAGKLSTLQAGFDSGFNLVGAHLGSRLGALRGEAQAMRVFLESQSSKLSIPIRTRNQAHPKKESSRSKLDRSSQAAKTVSGGESAVEGDPNEETSRAALQLEIEDPSKINAETNLGPSSSPYPSTSTSVSNRRDPASIPDSDVAAASSSAALGSPLDILISLISELNKLTLSDLEPPDYEAMKHEKEHLEGRANEVRSEGVEVEDGGIVRESEEQRLAREDILPSFAKRLQEIRKVVFDQIGK